MKGKSIISGKGFGYLDSSTGLTCMIRCFECGKENLAMSVSLGRCAWCGHDPNNPDPPLKHEKKAA